MGRRVPSDENLAPYTPFYKYPRYNQQQYPNTASQADNMDMESSYFRRQPASILSTSKMVDAATDNRQTTTSWMEQQQHHQQQQQQHQQQQQQHMQHQHPQATYGNYDNISYINDKRYG